MPIGQPDFGQNPGTNPTAPSYDTGEDTTRLLMGGGSQARSGRWIFATGFEEGAIPFIQAVETSGTGLGYAGLYNLLTFQGLGALQLRPQALSGQLAFARKVFVYPSSSFGVEFQLYVSGLNPEIHMQMYQYGLGVSGNLFKSAHVVFVGTSFGKADLYIQHTSPSDRTLIQSNLSIGTFRHFKIVADLKNDLIKRVYFGSNYFELNAPTTSAAASPQTDSPVYFDITVYNRTTADNQWILIDNLIITADEP